MLEFASASAMEGHTGASSIQNLTDVSDGTARCFKEKISPMINMGRLASFARRSTPLWIVAIMLCWVAAAAAQPTGGLAAGVFEIDGNLVSEDASRFDWFTGTPGTNNGVIDPATCQGKVQLLPAFMDAAFYRDDHWAGNALDLTTFAGGGNKNNDCIAPSVAPWSLAPGSGPGKNDLTEAYSASYVDPATGDNWLMLAFATRSTNGSSEMDFEFNTEGLTVGATTLSGPGPDCGRTIGDFIVSINFEAGGSLPAPAIYTWDGTTYVPLDITPPPGEQPSFLVSVNTAPVSAPCGATTPDGTLSNEYITRQFAEIAINLTAAGVDLVDYCGKPQSTLGFKTRSSTGFTSSLKDVKLFPFHLVPSVESTITGTLGLCAGETTTLCGPDGAQSASPISYLWSTGETSQCITLSAAALGAGTHPVSLVVSNTFGCRDSSEVQVVVHPELQASVASASVCTGESATLTPVVGNATAPLAYAWSNGATSASIVVNEAGEYCVTITDANGCEAHACGTLVVHAPVVVAVSDQAVCSGETGTMTAAVTSGGTAPFTYSWSNGANTESIAVTAAGEYCVTVTDANGCTANACGTLVVRPALQVTVGDAAVCAGETATLSCATTNGTGPFTMVWSTGSTAPTITVGESGDYCVTVTDANGCVGQACGTLTVRAPVEVDLGNIEICTGETATLRPGVTGAVAPMSCLWSTGATTATLAVSQSGEYSVTVTDANGCVGTAVATVIVHPAITAAVADIAVCSGENATLEAVVSTGDAPFRYEWNNGATSAKITVTTPGEYCVTVTDANGCVGQACGTLAVRPALQVAVGDAAVCDGETATLRCTTTNGTGPYTMVWSTGSTAPTITVGESGDYCVTVTDANGCVGQACGTLTVRAPVEVDLGNIEMCSGETATLRPGVTGAVAPMHCVWNTGATTATLVVSQSGEYSVTVTDANGCTGWARATVIVHPAITAAVANIAVCAGENGTLEALVSTGDAPFRYEWNTGATGAKITVAEAGEYCVTVTDANGCTGTACAVLTVYPEITAAVRDVEACDGEAGTLSANVTGGTAPYHYAWNTGETTRFITRNQAGEYCVTVTDANGCSVESCGQLLRAGTPVCEIEGPRFVCVGHTVTFSVDPQTGAPAVATTKPLASRRQAPMVPDLVDATLASAWLAEAPHAGPEPSVGPGKLFVDPTVTGMTIEWNVESSEGCQVLGDLTHPSLDVQFTAMGHYVIGVDLSSSAGCGSECEIEVVVVDCNAIGCPRTVGFWGQQCEQKGGGSTKFDRDEVQMIIDCADSKTLALNYGGGNEGFETFCEIIYTDDMNQRHQAKRQFSGMLANVCTGYLGLVAANGDSIRLFEPQPIDFPPFESKTIGALIDEMDEWLMELEHLDLEDAEVKSRYSEIIRVADSINNAIGIGATCFNFQQNEEIEADRPITRMAAFKPTPNPFKGQMSILYTLTGAQAQSVEIVVYDIAGRRVRVLENGLRTPGNSVTVWDGRDDHGVQAARGVYYVRGRLGDQKFTSRVVLLRD